ncbi:MAG: 2-iminoacetate synthase ThiH [Spirochaetales bacterium]|nr:2-iminoacetate synthase ThiH [Spirochaetales bacterium]
MKTDYKALKELPDDSDYITWAQDFSADAENVLIQLLQKDHFMIKDLPFLLSKEASHYLERMAVLAKGLTQQYHGNVMHVYVPLYLSNYCVNHCVYCGFNASNSIERKTLSLKEIEEEVVALSSQGHRDILLLTGEDPNEVPLSYLLDAVALVKQYFATVGIEIYPLGFDEYAKLVSAGVSHLALYQECYDRELYKQLHPKGPKSNYDFRLRAPEEAAKAGMAAINIGTLLGLRDWRKEIISGAHHLEYLQKKYPEVEYSYSFPRIRQYQGKIFQGQFVDDRDFVQAILALRLIFPHIGLSLSTRESASLRDHLIGLGITRMSAGSKTSVGGYVKNMKEDQDNSQFAISDHRDLSEISKLLENKGVQPVYKNWEVSV